MSFLVRALLMCVVLQHGIALCDDLDGYSHSVVPFRVCSRHVSTNTCYVVWCVIEVHNTYTTVCIVSVEPRISGAVLGRIAPGQRYFLTASTLRCLTTSDDESGNWEEAVEPGEATFENVFGDYDTRRSAISLANARVFRECIRSVPKSQLTAEFTTSAYSVKPREITVVPIQDGVSVQEGDSPVLHLSSAHPKVNDKSGRDSIRVITPERRIAVGGIRAEFAINGKPSSATEFSARYPAGGRALEMEYRSSSETSAREIIPTSITVSRLSDGRRMRSAVIFPAEKAMNGAMHGSGSSLETASETLRNDAEWRPIVGIGGFIPALQLPPEHAEIVLSHFQGWKNGLDRYCQQVDGVGDFRSELIAIGGWSRLLRFAIAMRDRSQVIDAAKGLYATYVRHGLTEFCIYSAASLTEVLESHDLGDVNGTICDNVATLVANQVDVQELMTLSRESLRPRFSAMILAICCHSLESSAATPKTFEIRIARLHACITLVKHLRTNEPVRGRPYSFQFDHGELVDMLKEDGKYMESANLQLTEREMRSVASVRAQAAKLIGLPETHR